MTSCNRKFDVLLGGTLFSRTANLNTLVLTRAVQICRVIALEERKYELPVAISDVWDINVLIA